MAKGTGGTRSVGSGSAASGRTTTPAHTTMRFTPSSYQTITGVNYYAQETAINRRLQQIEGVSDDTRTASGYRVKTVRDALLTRLDQINDMRRRQTQREENGTRGRARRTRPSNR